MRTSFEGRWSALRLLSSAVLGGVCLSLAALAQAGAETRTARLSFHWEPSHLSAQFATKFAEEIQRRSDGRLKIEIYPSGQLFGVREILGAVSSGAVEMGGIVNIVSLPGINRNYSIVATPGYFTSYEQQRRFWLETPEGQRVWNDILSRTRTRVLAYDPVGPAATFSTREKIDTVASMAGLSGRVLSDADRAYWTALGFRRMIAMPTSEVYTALQNGLIDTVSTVPQAVPTYSWDEHLKSAQLPYTYYSDAMILANQAWFSKLPKDLQEMVLQVGKETSDAATKAVMEGAAAGLKQFEADGGKVFELTGAELEKWHSVLDEKVAPAIEELVDAEVFSAMQKFVRQP